MSEREDRLCTQKERGFRQGGSRERGISVRGQKLGKGANGREEINEIRKVE